MKWNLSAPETAGVAAVGLGLSYLGGRLRGQPGTDPGMLFGGTALYTAGVVIGTNRPKGGYMGLGTKRKRKKSKKKRKR